MNEKITAHPQKEEREKVLKEIRQLAREIEAALPRELSGEQQLALVRAYVKDNFVDKGMCADFAIHDKGTGNPHVHIMLTLRPLKENGQWGAKCRKKPTTRKRAPRSPKSVRLIVERHYIGNVPMNTLFQRLVEEEIRKTAESYLAAG